MKKVLFIDRDGTLIAEPDDFQVDSFGKLKLLPGVVTYLGRIAAETDYELVMISNQDGLGTEAHPEENFYPVHDFLIELLANEGINFAGVFIDRSFEHENKPTRKPGTGLLEKYLIGDYDLANSFVIGDRETDVQLARNLRAKAIFIKNPVFDPPRDIAVTAENWQAVYEFLKLPPRKVSHRRTTKETDISIEQNLARVSWQKSRHYGEQCRLAGAVRSDDAEQRTLFQLQRHVVERLETTERLADMTNCQAHRLV